MWVVNIIIHGEKIMTRRRKCVSILSFLLDTIAMWKHIINN
jgi:hypothetical protein